MNARDLRELLADVPDHHEVGIEVVSDEDTEVMPIEGRSDSRWDCTFALLVKHNGQRRVTLI
jgi:hypothetical protein